MLRRRRRRDDGAEDAGAGEAVTDAGPGADDDAPAGGGSAGPAGGGPHDSADVPEDGTRRLDLGPLKVPVAEGVDLRVDVGADSRPRAATAVSGSSALQLHVFAAPRSPGTWDGVRGEIAEQLTRSTGAAEEREGPFGTELHAQVPARTPDGSTSVLTPARFVGVDGPRWFLRGLFTGPAATDPVAAAPLEEVLRGVVVVDRGSEPRPAREPLPLVLPEQVADAARQAAAERVAAGGGDEGGTPGP